MMASSLFKSMQKSPGENPFEMLGQLKANPQGFLSGKGFNVPEGMTDPNQIIQHLLQSGQISNARLSYAQQLMRMMNR